jgi:GGDEF domain-containing protein
LAGTLFLPAAPALAQSGLAPPPDALAVLVACAVLLACALLYWKKGPDSRTTQAHERTRVSAPDARPQRQPLARARPRLISISLPELTEEIAECIRKGRESGTDLAVLELAADAPLRPGDSSRRAEFDQTLLSVSRLHAARLYRFGPEGYLAICCGALPHQARRMAEDYRQSIVDLGLDSDGQPLTISIGMCSGPSLSDKGPRDFIACARARLDSARQLGGNRVESWRV